MYLQCRWTSQRCSASCIPGTSPLFTGTWPAWLGPDAADDLAAETFLVAFRRRHRFDPARGAARPWLFGIATNLVAQHRRAESRWYAALARAGADPLIAPSASAGDEDRIADRVAAFQARPALAAVLARLPDRDRDVLLLVAVGGLSYAEVAFALGIPEGTVGSRLNRARRKIIAALSGRPNLPRRPR